MVRVATVVMAIRYLPLVACAAALVSPLVMVLRCMLLTWVLIVRSGVIPLLLRVPIAKTPEACIRWTILVPLRTRVKSASPWPLVSGGRQVLLAPETILRVVLMLEGIALAMGRVPSWIVLNRVILSRGVVKVPLSSQFTLAKPNWALGEFYHLNKLRRRL